MWGGGSRLFGLLSRGLVFRVSTCWRDGVGLGMVGGGKGRRREGRYWEGGWFQGPSTPRSCRR